MSSRTRNHYSDSNMSAITSCASMSVMVMASSEVATRVFDPDPVTDHPSDSIAATAIVSTRALCVSKNIEAHVEAVRQTLAARLLRLDHNGIVTLLFWTAPDSSIRSPDL